MGDLGMKAAVTLALSVKDRKAAAAWYVDKLGFELLFDVDEIGFCELQTSVPGVTLGLADRDEIQAGGFVPTFDIEDLDSARARLEGLGVEFDGPSFGHEGFVKLAAFKDLDGHTLMLAEDLRE